jgi:hypothetical protein
MPYASALFVARPSWVAALAAGAKCVALHRDAVDDGLISEDMWKPFVELLPFDRVEMDLAPSELEALHRVLGVEAMPRAPTLNAREASVFESLAYDFAFVLDPSMGHAFRGSTRALLAQRADAWSAAIAGRTELHGALDIGRTIDAHALLAQLDTFFNEASEHHPKAKIFFVGYIE